MPDLCVDHWDEAKDGPVCEENVRRKLESEGYTCTRYTFTPGTVFADHTHGYTKKDAIASGLFMFSMHGQNVVLRPGDMIEVPAGTVHNAAVLGSDDVIFFDSTK